EQPPIGAHCHIVALGFTWRRDYRQLASAKQVFAGCGFIHWLLDRGHLQQLPQITNGSLVLYFDGPIWTHAGIGQGDGTILSKWGDNPLFRHPVDQVPTFYGNIVRAYAHPGTDTVMAHFRAFVEDWEHLPSWLPMLTEFMEEFTGQRDVPEASPNFHDVSMRG